MPHEFETLIRFLEKQEAEVGGRGQPLPMGEVREQIERLVSGGCSEEEKEQICEVVRDHPACVKWMAERVKAKRNQAEK